MDRTLARTKKRHYSWRVAMAGRPTSLVFAWPGAGYTGTVQLKTRSRHQAARTVFAPFVYRLGRHPFTVERAVRFR